ncbi:MAG: DegT/DnrJ/EryC1/StrS aminotransferase family protein [Sulfuricella sp.]|nr:DegT/DnrJ/EryC1/StrS aminotransferase family protein [Sulfuricella sp.]
MGKGSKQLQGYLNMASAIKPFYLDLSEGEIQDIQRVFGNILRSGQLILAKYTEQFEREFAAYIGCQYAVSMNTATSVLEVLCTLKGTRGKKVAVASNTNFASVAAIIRAGGQPVFMDMTEEHFVPNLDILRHTVEKYGVDGVMWVHIGGIIAPDFFEVVEYCNKNGLFLIEDAAHAHGSKMGGVSAGNFAGGGAFSFFPTKVMTTMEGGMLTTNSKDEADLAKSFRNQGKRHAAYGGLHYDLGSSWRISEIGAYLGLVQLAKLDQMVAVRNRAANLVAGTLKEIGVPYCDTSHMDQASQYKFIVRLPSHLSIDVVKKQLEARGVFCGGGVYEVPCHLQPVFADIAYDKEDLAVTENWCPRHICPPITSGTTDEDTSRICEALKEVLI